MGNKNNKLKKLPKFTSPATLDELPVEIIYKIFDELDICTIFTSLYHVCKRLDEILLTYQKYHLNLKNLTLTNLNLICSCIRAEQVTELTLSDDETSSGLIELFLSKFSLDTFECLRSLTLIQINNEEYLNQILIAIADHQTLLNFSSIKIVNSEESYNETAVEIIMSVLTKPSLRNVHLDLSYIRTTSTPLPWIEESSIQHLTFLGTCSVNFIRNILICVPQLETLKLDDFDFDEEINLNHVPDNQDDGESDWEDSGDEDRGPKKERFASIDSPSCLKSLVLNLCTMSMKKLEWILEEMPTLKSLRLITTSLYDDETILDGQRWENLLTNIDKFEFVFLVRVSVDSEWDVDICMNKFRTPFWIEKKQWFVSLEKYDEEIILYTLPYLNSFFLMKHEVSSSEYRSTANEDSILKAQSMKNVVDLYIDTSTMKISQFENIVSPRFSHVTKLYLYGKWPKSKTFFTDIQTIVDLNTIEELIRDECVPTADFITLLNLIPKLHSIKTTTILLDALNAAKFCHQICLRSFVIDSNTYGEQRSINIEPFCAMFPRIQNLVIPIDNVENCRYAIEQLKDDLISVSFRIPNNDDILTESDDENENEEDNSTTNAFSEWIKELPKQYRVHKKQQLIHIWLK